MVGAVRVRSFGGETEAQRASQWVAALIAGLTLGYSSRLAFGCNVGAYFSGISSGSLHGWLWFAAALAGSYVGILLRPAFGMEGLKAK